MTVEYRMYLELLQKPLCPGWFKTTKRSNPPGRKKRLNSSKDNLIANSSGLYTKRNPSILLNFLFPLVSFIGVFSILKFSPPQSVQDIFF